MRSRTLLLFLVTLLVIVSIPAMNVFATPHQYPSQAKADVTVCEDAKLVKAIRADFGTIELLSGDQVGAMKPLDLYTKMTTTAELRQKYEDMDSPEDTSCMLLVIQTINYLASIGDYYTVASGLKLGAKPVTVGQNLDKIATRQEKWANNLGDLMGPQDGQ